MIPLKVENWLITENGIEWLGKNRALVPCSTGKWLFDEGIGERKDTYDVLIHFLSNPNLKKADIYALNSAFIMAIKYFNLEFNTLFFANSLILQQKMWRS